MDFENVTLPLWSLEHENINYLPTGLGGIVKDFGVSTEDRTLTTLPSCSPKNWNPKFPLAWPLTDPRKCENFFFDLQLNLRGQITDKDSFADSNRAWLHSLVG